jgi:hypothetical protein
MRRIFLVTLLLLAVSPAVAYATWGGECSYGEGHHCYAVTEWLMSGGSESVKGATFVPTTLGINVPEWSTGAFVDDEGWLSFWESGGWLEAGQEAGNWLSCCTLHPFIAHAIKVNSKGKAVGYEQYTWETVEASPTNVYRIEDPEANGTWCEYIWSSQVDCKTHKGYWTTYGTLLEAGIEAASEHKPSNVGNQEVNYIAHSGEARAWSSETTGYVSPGPYAKKELCLVPNGASPYPGNADWSTCE